MVVRNFIIKKINNKKISNVTVESLKEPESFEDKYWTLIVVFM